MLPVTQTCLGGLVGQTAVHTGRRGFKAQAR